MPADWQQPAHNKLPTGCKLCDKEGNLLRCAGCQMFHYCSREHQVQDRPDHKGLCNKIKRAKKDLAQKKQALIEHPDFQNDNPFENHVGRFWKIKETRSYMNALSELAMMTQSTRHSDSLQAEYDSCKELLRLCPGDNMGVRATVPSVLLRLGKDQECYDFMKWFV